MLKKKAFRRIFITTVSLFVVFIIYTLVFTSNNNIKEEKIDLIDTKDMQAIYTLNEDNYLVRTNVYVDNAKTVEEKVKTLLEIMIINNNKNALLPSDLKPILPKNTKVLSVTLDNDILNINFSSHLLSITKEQSENMIEAIIYTTSSFKEVLGVQIYVEGKILKYVPNTNKKIISTLNTDFGINKIYDITSTKDIEKVILYYYYKGSNGYYYVPVTKYVNNSKEKLEIIVEELNNYNILDNNLITFLSSKTKLISYEINKDIIKLNFNKEIINDDLKAMEELILSIFDNYDVEKVEILAENEKILEKNKKTN